MVVYPMGAQVGRWGMKVRGAIVCVVWWSVLCRGEVIFETEETRCAEFDRSFCYDSLVLLKPVGWSTFGRSSLSHFSTHKLFEESSIILFATSNVLGDTPGWPSFDSIWRFVNAKFCYIFHSFSSTYQLATVVIRKESLAASSTHRHQVKGLSSRNARRYSPSLS